MKIKDIKENLCGMFKIEASVGDDLQLHNLVYDSRKIGLGDLFVAISGNKLDGHSFVPAAIEKGAAAVVVEHYLPNLPPDFPQLITKDSRIALSQLSALWYNYPDRKMRLVGVTGTNGKTTTTWLIKYLWQTVGGQKSGLVGTIRNYASDKPLDSTHTTPESLELYQLFAQMLDEGCQNAVMEVSSHALKQGRVAACAFDGVVFTNLTQDHLDYHITLDDYRSSKGKLFTTPVLQQNNNPYAVINIDDQAGRLYAAGCPAAQVLTYGENAEAALRFSDYHHIDGGGVYTLNYNGNQYTVKIPLLGRFNVYNTLAALGVCLAEGLPLDDCLQALKTAPQVAGRMELVDCGQDFIVAVDYAHTPDGLLNVLAAAREMNPRHLIVVFGCGGDRDNGKRPIMGRIAGENSDFTVITSDNPRTEDPNKIIKQIQAGIDTTQGRYLIEPDRQSAIFAALKMAQNGDIVVIAGKGHEDYQLVMNKVLHFDDCEVVRELLAQILAK